MKEKEGKEDERKGGKEEEGGMVTTKSIMS